MHVIEETDRFTLLGADARRGKLTLFDAEGPREPGALVHVGLRVARLDGAAREVELGEGLRRPAGRGADRRGLRPRPRRAALGRSRGDGARLRALRLPPPAPGGGVPRVEVGGALVELHDGDPRRSPSGRCSTTSACSSTRPRSTAPRPRRRGIEVDDVVDAPNTLAVFVWLPERVKLEYVEHKSDVLAHLSRSTVTVAGAGMAGLVAAARLRELGVDTVVLEKGDRAGGSMLLSSGVVWRHHTAEAFAAECPAGDPALQRAVVERLDDALAVARVARRAGRRARDGELRARTASASTRAA